MSYKRIEIPVGTRFGLLTVIKNDSRVEGGDGKLRWGCTLLCACGNKTTIKNGRLLSKTHPPKHCGQSCLARWSGNDKGLGIDFDNQPGWYRSYNAMKQRCLDPNASCFKNYGGRGITVCDRWLNDPLAFYEDMGDRPEGHTIDRIDNDGNYEPGNCRWATSTEQARNKRNTRPTSEQQKNLASN